MCAILARVGRAEGKETEGRRKREGREGEKEVYGEGRGDGAFKRCARSPPITGKIIRTYFKINHLSHQAAGKLQASQR